MWIECTIRWDGRQRNIQNSGAEHTKLDWSYVWAPRNRRDASKQWANYRTKSKNCRVNSTQEINGWAWSPKSVIKAGAAHRGPFQRLQWHPIGLAFRQRARKPSSSLHSIYFRVWDVRPVAVAVIWIGHGIIFVKLGKLFFFLPFLFVQTLTQEILHYFNRSLVDEECFPYSAVPSHCKVQRTSTLSSIGCQLPTTVPRDHMYRVGPAYSLNNETDIMIEIMESGPVQGKNLIFFLSEHVIDRFDFLFFYVFFSSHNACLSRFLFVPRRHLQTFGS